MLARKRMGAVFSVVAVLAVSSSALAGSHQWRFSEIFTNPDGTVQFIELKECCGAGSEIFVTGKDITSVALGEIFVFPGNLSGNTANRHLLLATQSFADLPDAPTPDYIIPGDSLPLFSLNGDTLTYWLYTDATVSYLDTDLPTNGTRSLFFDPALSNPTIIGSGLNNPTNFAGETGTVDASCTLLPYGDVNASGDSDADDLLCMIDVLQGGICDGIAEEDLDIEPCAGNSELDLKDLINLLDALAGLAACPDHCL